MSNPKPHAESSLEDWEWVVSEEAKSWLDELARSDLDAISWAKVLRKKGLSPSRIRLAMTQLTLRPMAEKKFANSAKMFFERVLLEQATDERLARFKARRFRECESVVDVCCGLGGDLISLAKHSVATAVDSREIACLIAGANCVANDVCAEIVAADANDFPFDEKAWVHVDPDRRVGGRRSTKLDYFSPKIDVLTRIIEQQKNVAVKLAPSTKVPPHWDHCQKHWIGDRQECKQLVAWFGETTDHAGVRTATAIDRDDSILFEWTQETPGRCELANQIGPFLYEPHPTIIAGRMIDSLANHLGLSRIASDIQYLTGAEILHPGLTSYEVLETCRIDIRDVRDRLERLDCGRLEVKKRGVELDLLQRFSRLRWNGSQTRVLVLTRLHQKYVAIICNRRRIIAD